MQILSQEHKLLSEVQLTDPFRPRLMKVHGKLENQYKIVSNGVGVSCI